MSSASPLSYYSDERPENRRPGEVTAVAVGGIVLAGIAIVGQMFVAQGPYEISARAGIPSAFNIGFAFGRLISIGLVLLMLVGCCGLLSMRWAGRMMVMIAAGGWVLLSIVSSFYLVYAQLLAPAGPRGATTTTTAWMALLPAVMLVVQLVFGIWALEVMRRPALAWQFVRQESLIIPPIVKAVALVTLVYSGLGAMETLAEAAGVAFKLSGPRTLMLSRTLPLNLTGSADVRLLDPVVALLLQAGFIAGSLLAMKGNIVGARVLVVCAMARLAFTIGLWAASNDYFSTLLMNSRSLSAWDMFCAVVYLLYTRTTSLMTPALLLMVFSYRTAAGVRPAKRAAAIASGSPLDAPSPA